MEWVELAMIRTNTTVLNEVDVETAAHIRVSLRKKLKAQPMQHTYTAVVKRVADAWIGWIEEVPGVNCQETSREELLESLRITLVEAIEFNRAEAIGAAGHGFEELPIAV
ncbi:type II toxin-antitoxin system HicB family antitoxin [Dyella sp. KRB-257]|uniref:type II toxin-antitoxin system HicB family antitoxin n=1 Tax=Dyella sp. KRB-257 TaxID=3400915 RepID=UPI003C127AA9